MKKITAGKRYMKLWLWVREVIDDHRNSDTEVRIIFILFCQAYDPKMEHSLTWTLKRYMLERRNRMISMTDAVADFIAYVA